MPCFQYPENQPPENAKSGPFDTEEECKKSIGTPDGCPCCSNNDCRLECPFNTTEGEEGSECSGKCVTIGEACKPAGYGFYVNYVNQGYECCDVIPEDLKDGASCYGGFGCNPPFTCGSFNSNNYSTVEECQAKRDAFIGGTYSCPYSISGCVKRSATFSDKVRAPCCGGVCCQDSLCEGTTCIPYSEYY